MALTTFNIKMGDRLPRFRTTLVDGTGTVINLTTATAVLFRMRALKAKGLPPSISQPATIIDAPNGVVEYAWGATDTLVAGRFEAEWVVTFPGGLQTNPNDLSVYVVDIVPNLLS
jgi:hypothetical protein